MKLKKLIPFEFEPRYADFDKVRLHHVEITGKHAKGLKKLNLKIYKLVFLLPMETSENSKFFIREAVIDPSISRDDIYTKIKRKLFAPVAQKFDKQIKNLSLMLSSIKIKKMILPKIMKPVKKVYDMKKFNSKIDKVLNTLKGITFPFLPHEYTVQGVSNEINHFQNLLKEELSKINLEPSNIHLKKVSKDTKTIVRDFKSIDSKFKQSGKGAGSPKNQKKVISQKIDLMSKAIEDLRMQMVEMDKAQETYAQKVQAHESSIKKIVKKHRKNMSDAVNANTAYLKKIKKFIRNEKQMKVVGGAVSRQIKGQKEQKGGMGAVMSKEAVKNLVAMEKKYAVTH